jgi:tetratricopeptide (TPR) repeat protein/lambda repressor-like predicted transcriptional regulator/DNA-binding transcriptional ArsR family regulator
VPDQDFAADLDLMRLTAGLSLRELVRLTGIPRSTLSDALAGRRMPRLEAVLAIARACAADPEQWRRRWAALSTQRFVPADAAAGPAVASAGPPATTPGGRVPAATAPTEAAFVPAQLPRDVGGFTSREHEIARLGRGGVAVIHGRPGVGKTALAVHWAHSISSQYPDGQLFLDVRGHHPTLRPMSPAEAMGRLLGSIDVRWVPLTEDPEEGVGLWRSSLARRRLLIVLDDAISADQVRPLVPSAPGCCMIVTSRHYLADLIVRDGADGIVLDGLPPESSLDLLSHVVGPKRVTAEPAAAAAVATACGHLPLALRLAGAMLAGAPERSFAELLDELATGDRLTALEGLARPSAVEHAFELSYLALPEDARFLFRRLGLHPGPDISALVAALLSDLSPATARSLLRLLAEAHLIEPGRMGRYRMHDLLRDYAARLVEESDEEPGRDAARRRLLDWYVDGAVAVSARLDTGRARLWVDEALASAWEPGEDEAAAWVRSEHRNIVAVIEYDARRGTGRHAWSLVDLMSTVMFRRTDVTGLIVAADAGLDAARRHGEQHAESAMCVRRGWLRWRAGRGEGAAQDFTRARALARQAGTRRTEASALRGLSICHADAGRLEEARRCAEEALALYRAEGDRNGEAATLNTLAVAIVHAGDFSGSEARFDAALALYREAGSRGYIALALCNLAHLHGICGSLATAIACAEEAVEVARAIGDGFAEVVGLSNGAQALDRAGRAQEAYRWAAAATARAGELGYGLSDAAAIDALATASRALGLPDASAHRSRAVACARAASDLVKEAEILVGAARDAYQDAVSSPARSGEGFAAARAAATRALDAGLAAHTLHGQAEALSLAAACDLALGQVTGALGAARRAVAMHQASGARLPEAAARVVLAHALTRHGDETGAEDEQLTVRRMLDDLAVPDAAPVRRLLASWPDAAFPPFA